MPTVVEFIANVATRDRVRIIESAGADVFLDDEDLLHRADRIFAAEAADAFFHARAPSRFTSACQLFF